MLAWFTNLFWKHTGALSWSQIPPMSKSRHRSEAMGQEPPSSATGALTSVVYTAKSRYNRGPQSFPWPWPHWLLQLPPLRPAGENSTKPVPGVHPASRLCRTCAHSLGVRLPSSAASMWQSSAHFPGLSPAQAAAPQRQEPCLTAAAPGPGLSQHWCAVC